MAVELHIGDVAFGGKGVARSEGKAVFVPYVVDGETVSARITRERRKFSEAELETVLVISPHRVEARCPYFGRCGGCVYQHIAYEHQLELKARQVKETLSRIGGMADLPMRSIVASPSMYEYRNRITVHARDGVVGYYRRESSELIDVDHCPIASPEVNNQLSQLRAGRPRDGHYSLRGQNRLRVFRQANNEVAQAMLELVEQSLGLGNDTLIDAYCGSGLFSKHLRSRFRRVVGIDWDRRAIGAAESDAQPHERYIAGEVERELPRLLTELATSQVSLIIDPPAAGLTEKVRQALHENPPERVFYISCNPPTLARDLADLREGFVIQAVTPLDMFPQTAEIEVAVQLTRR